MTKRNEISDRAWLEGQYPPGTQDDIEAMHHTRLARVRQGDQLDPARCEEVRRELESELAELSSYGGVVYD
jgi:hypothetical protein